MPEPRVWVGDRPPNDGIGLWKAHEGVTIAGHRDDEQLIAQRSLETDLADASVIGEQHEQLDP